MSNCQTNYYVKSKKETYVSPIAEEFLYVLPHSVLATLSIEAEVEDFVEGDAL